MAVFEPDLETPSYAGVTDGDLRLIQAAARSRPHGIHGVDIRLSVPVAWRRYYLAIMAGTERRDVSRRALDRETRPLATLGNVLFVTAGATLLMLASFAVVLLASGIVEI